MSHFVVAVIHRDDQNIEELLAPYNENFEVDPYLNMTREEAIQFYRENYESEDKTDEECVEELREIYTMDEEGNLYSTYNPNSKWDWWVIGGRWSGMLKVGDDYKDSAYIKDIDFSPNQKSYKRALDFWEVVVEGKEPKEKDEFFSLYNKKYYQEYYGDKETYARYVSQFSTFAVLTSDGKWHEQGSMGWFGVSSDTPEEFKNWKDNFKKQFIDTADPNWKMTIVDCHI